MVDGYCEPSGQAPPGMPECLVIMWSCMVGMLHCSVAARVLREELCAGKAVIDEVKKARVKVMRWKDNIMAIWRSITGGELRDE
jgi:hypothetical protein